VIQESGRAQGLPWWPRWWPEGLSLETVKTYLRHTKVFLGRAVRQKYLLVVPHIEIPKRRSGVPDSPLVEIQIPISRRVIHRDRKIAAYRRQQSLE
jgi:hypothetical protein